MVYHSIERQRLGNTFGIAEPALMQLPLSMVETLALLFENPQPSVAHTWHKCRALTCFLLAIFRAVMMPKTLNHARCFARHLQTRGDWAFRAVLSLR
jgi:hypothetical protein